MRQMKKLRKWLPSKRKLMQLYFALLFNANLKGFSHGSIYQGGSKAFCIPGLNCYSCPGAIGACPLGALQGAFSADHTTIFYVLGILGLYGLLLGRTICGWLCPFGLIQELLHKIPTPKLKKGPVTKALSLLKYVILVVFVILIPILYALRNVPLPAFCKFICPAGTLEGGLGLLSNAVNESYFSMLGGLFTWKFLLMVSILTGCIFVFRLFCRFLCPLGALYGLFKPVSLLGVQVDQNACVDCGKCTAHCKVDIRHVGDAECIDCGSCAKVCPTGAITFKGEKWLFSTNSDKKKKLRPVLRILCALILPALLIGSLLYYNAGISEENSTVISVGDACPGMKLERIDAQGLTGETIDPAAPGKITLINFWGTWCGPCVEELPAFNRIAKVYSQQVQVIAVHTHMIWDTAPAFLAEYYPNSPILFAVDRMEDNQELYYGALGGRGTYPYTVLVDSQGIIRRIFTEPLTYEDLQSALSDLLQ